MQLYSAGRTDFLNVLQAQGTLYASENAFVQSNSSASQDLIALYKALGGGWESEAGQVAQLLQSRCPNPAPSCNTTSSTLPFTL